MVLDTSPVVVPLRTDNDGVIRVGPTRVTIDSVVHAFQDGATAEEIVYRYPTLELANVYEAIAYYLRHREEVDAYLAQRGREAEEVRREAEAFFGPSPLRERLLNRRSRG